MVKEDEVIMLRPHQVEEFVRSVESATSLSYGNVEKYGQVVADRIERFVQMAKSDEYTKVAISMGMASICGEIGECKNRDVVSLCSGKEARQLEQEWSRRYFGTPTMPSTVMEYRILANYIHKYWGNS